MLSSQPYNVPPTRFHKTRTETKFPFLIGSGFPKTDHRQTRSADTKLTTYGSRPPSVDYGDGGGVDGGGAKSLVCPSDSSRIVGSEGTS